MLTLAKSNTTQAKNYYKQENYYSEQEAEANSQWQGKGASGYQLSGAITDLSAYDKIVNGLSPDGKTQLRQKQSHDSKKERAGTDLTFSAPKSVSIACLVGGDTRLEEAHRKAVSRTIDLIESRYATTRINGQPVQTDNLIVAKWHHDTSRELDPHLHTHCLIMNCTQGPDGKWRSIDNKAFYQNKILLGQIYRNELAIECRKLGYEIEPHPQELFEIKGYTREQIEGFSKRHEQIKNKLIEIGAELTTENKAWAWRKTRAKKNHEIRREEKLPYWQEEADLYGITHPIAIRQQVVESTSNQQNEQIAAEITLAVDAAIEHCSERKVAFTGEDIEKFVTSVVKPFSIIQLEQAILAHPELIKTYDGRYTTQTASLRELATIRLMEQGKGQVKAIATPEIAETYLADKKLTLGQREAIVLTATTTDQFVAWQGVAGAGKTYALNEVKQIATALQDVAPRHTIKGFAPSAEAAKVLEEELGIEANTVAHLLVSQKSEQPPPNQIWIVDEAGLLSAKNAYSLLQRAIEEGARVILVGHTRQLSAIEAGNPFKSLQSAGITTANLDESVRQKPPDLQKVVGLAANGQLGEAIAHLKQLDRLQEVADVNERTAKIAADYINLTPEERKQTLIIAGTHKERTAIVGEIRTELKEEGRLGYGVEVTQLRARQDLTSVQTRYTHNYKVGDVVVPVRDYKRLGLYKAQPYLVKAILDDRLHLQDLAGNHLVVEPIKFRKTLYQQESIDIAVGDRLKWTRNDKELGRRNGQEFTVTSIDGHTATIELPGGKTDTIDLYGPLHLDHALVATTYSSQGKTANRVLISSTVDATVSQESVYVAISRAKYDLKIYAENIDYLLEQAQESKAQETVWEVLNPPSKVKVAAALALATSQPKAKVAIDVVEAPQLKRKKSSIVSIEQPSKQHQVQGKAQVKVRPILKKEPPKQLEVFWQPTSAQEAPPHIEAKHWRELVEGSAIHPDIAALNFRSLQMGSIEQEHQAWEYLMYSHKLERTNIGQLTTGMLKRYAHIEAGGWWCNSGANALSFSNLDTGEQPQEKIWGCYKPNQPRSNPDKPGKVIKYEHPPKTDLGIFLLDVPDYVAQKIYQKAGIDPSSEDRDRGFWYCVWKHNLPIVITEGAKKAASLLSQGHAAIGLPGIYAGYRSKDEQGNPIKAHLHEELAVFATLGREMTFCFDYETRPETKRNIDIAISRTGSLLRQQGAKVSVVNLPGPEKGVDDLIVARSPLAFEQQLLAALPLQQWREANKQQRQSAIAPPQKLSIEQRKERLNQSLSGQPPIHDQNLNQSLEQTSDDSIKQQLNRESTADREHNYTDSAHQLDTNRRTIESSEPRSFAGERQPDEERRTIENSVQTNLTRKQGNEDIQPAVEQYSLSDRANAGRLQRWVQESAGVIEIGQEELSLGQSLNNSQNLNQSQEQNSHDTIDWRQSSNERATDGGVDQSHNLIDQENRSVGENQQPTDQQQQSVERTNPAPGNYPNREPGRIENQPLELLAAISRHLELQTIEQLGANIAELSRSLADGGLRGQGTAFLSSSIDRQDPAIVDRAAGDESIERRGGNDGRVNGQLIEAIANYIQVETIAQSAMATPAGHGIAQDIHNLCQDFLGNQFQSLSEVMRKLDAALPRKLSQSNLEVAPSVEVESQAAHAIANYVAARTIQDTTLAQELLPLSQQLTGLQHQGLTSAIHQLTNVIEEAIALQPKLQLDQEHQGEQSIKAVVSHIQHEEIASPLIQPLTELTQQLADGQSQSSSSLNLLEKIIADHLAQTQVTAFKALQQKVNQQALLAASNHAEHETLALALVETIPPLIAELSQHRQQLAQGKAALDSLEQLLDELATDRTIAAVAGYIEGEVVTQYEDIPTALENLTNDLVHEQGNSLPAVNRLDVVISSYLEQAKAREQQIITGAQEAVSKHVEQSAVETLPLIPALVDLTKQLKFNSARAAVSVNQLDEVISSYLQQIEPLLPEKQRQITNTAIASISQQINLSAISSSPAISACNQIEENLRMLHTANNTKALKKVHAVVAKYIKETEIALAQQLRDLPLDEIAPRLGLVVDKRDPHKWRCVGQTISINDQKFYDHHAKQGGYGAIDLVMHVQGSNFKQALQWLADSALELPPVQIRSPQLSEPSLPKSHEPTARERQPFTPPVPDKNKWHEVRQYLVEKRGLPAPIVDKLHSDGKIYATGVDKSVLAKLRAQSYSSPEKITNAVFLRHNLNEEVTGASLRGVADNSLFKGLSTGSQREGGWFSFVQGGGELKRIVIVESAIDALSAAALAKQQGQTMFVSTDGAGSVPIPWLRQQQQQGVEIVAAHDSDRPGEEMAWRLAAELGAVTRATPTTGKDWNEHLLGIESQLDPAQWKLLSQAIGKPDAYLGRIEAVVTSGQPLPSEAVAAMREDFANYRQTASDLWQWHQGARDIDKSDAYLERIAQIAIAFHHPKSPTPLSEAAELAMQIDIANYHKINYNGYRLQSKLK